MVGANVLEQGQVGGSLVKALWADVGLDFGQRPRLFEMVLDMDPEVLYVMKDSGAFFAVVQLVVLGHGAHLNQLVEDVMHFFGLEVIIAVFHSIQPGIHVLVVLGKMENEVVLLVGLEKLA